MSCRRECFMSRYMGYRLSINCYDNGVKFYGRKGVNTLNLDKFESYYMRERKEIRNAVPADPLSGCHTSLP